MLIPLLLITSLHQIVIGLEDFSKKGYNPSEVVMQYRIIGYNNPTRMLSNGKSCDDDSLEESNDTIPLPTCVFQLKFDFLTPGKNTQSDDIFVQLDENGQLTEILKHIWGSNQVKSFPAKPATLRVTVRSFGPVLKNRIVHQEDVDVFVIPLENLFPRTQTNRITLTDQTYEGQIIGTSLTLQMSITCSGPEIAGPNCDLKCIPSKTDQRLAECVSVITGEFYICQYVDDNLVGRQVDFCKDVENGDKLMRFEIIEDKWRRMTFVLTLFSFILLVFLNFLMFKQPTVD